MGWDGGRKRPPVRMRELLCWWCSCWSCCGVLPMLLLVLVDALDTLYVVPVVACVVPFSTSSFLLLLLLLLLQRAVAGSSCSVPCGAREERAIAQQQATAKTLLPLVPARVQAVPTGTLLHLCCRAGRGKSGAETWLPLGKFEPLSVCCVEIAVDL